MSPYDEDLSPFENDPVFKALTGPASAAELSGEATALAAFRSANGAKPHRRFAARLGAGGGVVVAVVALSGGVAAAAYSNALPSTVQNFAHTVAGPLGVPDKHVTHHHKVLTQHPAGGGLVGGTGPGSTGPSGAAGGPNPAPAAIGSPAASPSAGAKKRPSVHASAKSRPTTSPTSTVAAAPVTSTSPAPVDTTTPTPTPVTPAALSISVSQTRAPAGSTVDVVGNVTGSAGQPVAGYEVSLLQHLPGSSGTTLLATSQSAADGSVQFTTAPLTRTAQFVLRAGTDVRSAPVRVVVVPTMSAVVNAAGSTDQVSISVQGAQVGDAVTVYQRQAGSWVAVRTLTLDSGGSAGFTTAADPTRSVGYRAVLAATSAHAGATVEFVTQPAATSS